MNVACEPPFGVCHVVAAGSRTEGVVGAPLTAVSDSRCLRHSSPADARAADGERGGAAGGKHGCLLATRATFEEVRLLSL